MTAGFFPSIKSVPVEQLIPYARNARTHSDEQIAQIAASIREFGWTNPILVDGERGIIAVHGRLAAARKLGMADVPVIELQHLTEAQKRAYILADNKLAINAGWDDELLKIELSDLKDSGFDLDLIGFSEDELSGFLDFGGIFDENSIDGQQGSLSLSERFMVPPFSVLNAREGWWQERKRQWISVGIKSEEGRGESGGQSNKKKTGGVLMKSWTSHPDFYTQKKSKEAEIGKSLSTAEFIENYFVPPTGGAYASGTSIFDPVLCEVVYRWFSPKGGMVIDPFCGGSVRGIVAAILGREYFGNDLRAEQVEANQNQWQAVQEQGQEWGEGSVQPIWHVGDSRNIDKYAKGVQADLVFSCPPYADLEVYSDDPSDLSNLGYDEFIAAYREIIKKSCALLKQDRFACFVVGEVRGKGGGYYDFVGDTVQAFMDAGLSYYNEAILVTAVGSLPVRVGRQFSGSRKLGKTHQNILVFVKGDGKAAASACGDVAIDDGLFPESQD